MKLELTPTAPDDVPPSALDMRTQRYGRIVAVLDGDAHLHVWEPNRGADGFDVDLTTSLAVVIDLGIDARPAPHPHWTGRVGSTTLIVSLDAGADGTIMIDGHRISEAAAVNLAANGFIRLLDDWAAERDGRDAETATEPPTSEPSDSGDDALDDIGDSTEGGS